MKTKTAVELRYTTKKRVKKYNDKLKQEGKKAINVYLNQDTISVLDSLKVSHGFSKASAIEYIANIHKSVNKNANKEISIDNNFKGIGNALKYMSEIDFENQSVEINEESASEKIKAVSRGLKQSSKQTSNRKIEKIIRPSKEILDWTDKLAFKSFTLDLVKKYLGEGLSHQKTAERLTADGVKTRSGKDKWTKSMVQGITKELQN